jgi:hypothetical protein
MNFKKTTGLLAAAFGLVALFSVEASAQVPTVTASAVGNTVTIDVSLPPGAVGYTLFVGYSPGGSLVPGGINLPANITHIVVNAPSATYYLRARAIGFVNGGFIFGPESANVSVVAGSQPCASAPAAPTLSVNVANAEVTLNWDANPAQAMYEVGWSRFSGTTEFGDSTTSNTFTRVAPAVGSYFARVRTRTACGLSAFSNEVAFQVTNLALGSGPRTPDPPPGQLLPMPGYAPAVVQEIARRYPGDLAVACKGRNAWLFKLVRELRKYDSRWAMNWKRGWYNSEYSSDIVTYNGTNGPDVTATHVYLADVISGECESNLPVFNWQNVTQNTWNAARLNPGACGNRDCAAWTLVPYLNAGYPATSPADEGKKEQ